MTLSGSSVTWRGLTFVGSRGDGSRPWFDTLDGWEELPPARRDGQARQSGHGTFDSAVWSDERVVILAGACMSATERDAQLMAISGAMTFESGPTEPLTVTHAGRTLTGNARLTRFKAPPGKDWASGRFTWAAEWVCADPLRYASPVTVSTGFPVQSGGLEFDLYTDSTTDTGFLEYGVAGATGRILPTNTGNAAAWPVYEITGPIPDEGFEIRAVGSGGVIRFEGSIPSGSTLLIDSAQGAETALMDGVSDRSGQVTQLDPMPIPSNGSLELAFINLGAISAAQLTASFSPGSW